MMPAQEFMRDDTYVISVRARKFDPDNPSIIIKESKIVSKSIRFRKMEINFYNGLSKIYEKFFFDEYQGFHVNARVFGESSAEWKWTTGLNNALGEGKSSRWIFNGDKVHKEGNEIKTIDIELEVRGLEGNR